MNLPLEVEWLAYLSSKHINTFMIYVGLFQIPNAFQTLKTLRYSNHIQKTNLHSIKSLINPLASKLCEFIQFQSNNIFKSNKGYLNFKIIQIKSCVIYKNLGVKYVVVLSKYQNDIFFISISFPKYLKILKSIK